MMNPKLQMYSQPQYNLQAMKKVLSKRYKANKNDNENEQVGQEHEIERPKTRQVIITPANFVNDRNNMRNSSYKNPDDDARFEENIDQAFNLPFDSKLAPEKPKGTSQGRRNRINMSSWDDGSQLPSGILQKQRPKTKQQFGRYTNLQAMRHQPGRRIGGMSYEFFSDIVQRKKQSQTGQWRNQYHIDEIIPDLPEINLYNQHNFNQQANKGKTRGSPTTSTLARGPPEGSVAQSGATLERTGGQNSVKTSTRNKDMELITVLKAKCNVRSSLDHYNSKRPTEYESTKVGSSMFSGAGGRPNLESQGGKRTLLRNFVQTPIGNNKPRFFSPTNNQQLTTLLQIQDTGDQGEKLNIRYLKDMIQSRQNQHQQDFHRYAVGISPSSRNQLDRQLSLAIPSLVQSTDSSQKYDIHYKNLKQLRMKQKQKKEQLFNEDTTRVHPSVRKPISRRSVETTVRCSSMMEERRVGIDAYLNSNTESINEVKYVNVPRQQINKINRPTTDNKSQVEMKNEPIHPLNNQNTINFQDQNQENACKTGKEVFEKKMLEHQKDQWLRNASVHLQHSKDLMTQKVVGKEKKDDTGSKMNKIEEIMQDYLEQHAPIKAKEVSFKESFPKYYNAESEQYVVKWGNVKSEKLKNQIKKSLKLVDHRIYARNHEGEDQYQPYDNLTMEEVKKLSPMKYLFYIQARRTKISRQNDQEEANKKFEEVQKQKLIHDIKVIKDKIQQLKDEEKSHIHCQSQKNGELEEQEDKTAHLIGDIQLNQSVNMEPEKTGSDADLVTMTQPKPDSLLGHIFHDAKQKTQRGQKMQKLEQELEKLEDILFKRFRAPVIEIEEDLDSEREQELLEEAAYLHTVSEDDWQSSRYDEISKVCISETEEEVKTSKSQNKGLVSFKGMLAKYQSELKVLAERNDQGERTTQTIDFLFLARIQNLQSVLSKVIGDNGLGQKYLECEQNIFKVQAKEEENLDPLSDMEMSPSKSGNIVAYYEEEQKKQDFFAHARRGKLSANDIDPENNQIMQYYNNCQKHLMVPAPTFAQIHKNELMFSEQTITQEMAQTLKEFLSSTDIDECPQYVVKSICIVDCVVCDASLALILEGLFDQQRESVKLKQMITQLRTFVSIRNDLGRKSLQVLTQLLPGITSLHITKPSITFAPKILLETSLDLATNRLVSLNLSGTPLNDLVLIDLLQKLITLRDLGSLDVSWCNLSPKMLCLLSETLCTRQTFRSLNLGYNQLQKNCEYSKDFLANLLKFLKYNEALTHLDLSGMCWQEAQLLEIAQLLGEDAADNLISVHLSDNEICNENNFELRDEILDAFGVQQTYEDHNFTVNKPVKTPQKLKKIIMDHCNPMKMETAENNTTTGIFSDSEYLNNMKLIKQGHRVNKNKMMQMAKICEGPGRSGSSRIDQFILNRLQNSPELIFNQNPHLDKYFDIEANDSWRLSQGGCYVQQKHQYTMIFYQQSDKLNGQNDGLTELYPFQRNSKDSSQVLDKRKPEDQAKVDEIKAMLNIPGDNSKARKETEQVPYICGTVVRNLKGQSFCRKLKMLRVDLYSLLSVSQSKKFVKDWKQADRIQKGVLQLVKQQQNQSFTGIRDIEVRLKGWSRVLRAKCQENDVTDMQIINKPQDFDTGKIQCLSYVYCAYLPPGIHQFMIYCPKTDRIFCKEVAIDLNQKDLRPQLPLQPPKPNQRKIRQNIWKDWKEDSLDALKMKFFEDIQSGIILDFIDDPQDFELCKEMMFKNFLMIKNLFIEYQARSEMFPNLQGTVLQDLMTNKNENLPRYIHKLTQRALTKTFLEATDREKEGYLTKDTVITRAQFVEVLLRMGNQSKPRKMDLNQYLQPFLNAFVRGAWRTSELVSIRRQIRRSKQLNALLCDNKQGLEHIFKTFSDPEEGFTLESADQFFNKKEDSENERSAVLINSELLKIYFRFSLMNILETKMEFVEFLELVCRVALRLHADQDNKSKKKTHEIVQEFIEPIFKYLFDKCEDPSKRMSEDKGHSKFVPFVCDDDEQVASD